MLLQRRHCSTKKRSKDTEIPRPRIKKALAKSFRFKRRSLFDLFFFCDSQGDVSS
jgi:hypothetical protein